MKLRSFDPVVVPMPPKGVDDERVRERMSEIVSQIPCYDDVTDQPVASQDRAKVRLTMRENGAAMPGLDGAELTMTVGDGFFPQALSEGMVGMMPGETRHVAWNDAALGAEGEDDASASFEADVEVVSVRKRVRPEMSDTWVARHIPRCATLDEFFADVRSQLEEGAEAQWESLKRERCGIALAQRLEGDLPVRSLDRAIEGVRHEFELSLAREGKLRSEKAAEFGVSEVQLDELLASQGRLVAAQGEAARLMARHLGIEPDEAALDRALERAFPDKSEAERFLAGDGAHERLVEMARCEMALDAVVEAATVVDEKSSDNQGFGTSGEIAGMPYPNPFA